MCHVGCDMGVILDVDICHHVECDICHVWM